MKKISCFIITLMLIFALTSCDLGEIVIRVEGNSIENLIGGGGSPDTKTEVPNETETEEETTAQTDASEETSEPEETTEPAEPTESVETTEAAETTEPTETTEPAETTEPEETTAPEETTPSLDDVDNGVLKDASPESMDVPTNMQLLGTPDASEENNADKVNATVVTYKLDGEVVNWVTENDLVYVITSGNNRLVVIDSNSMAPVYNVPLTGEPAEINIIGDKIYISLPDLCRIDIFTKSNCTKERSIYFDHAVSSFCIDGDYIYYSEHDQWCKVFKMNLNTGKLTQIGSLFYYPKVYLNKEDRILYIGESGGTGSALYYYDADTLVMKSVFKKDNYGIMNQTREIFHIGDEIFWGSYRLSDTNAKELVGRYGVVAYGSVVFASPELVSTYEGLFLTDTYECIINYWDAKFDYEHILISDSYNVFFRERISSDNIIIGVNFKMQ